MAAVSNSMPSALRGAWKVAQQGSRWSPSNDSIELSVLKSLSTMVLLLA